MTDSSGLLYDHQYSYYYALTPFTLGILKSLFFLKIDYCLLKLDFSRLSFPDVTVTVAQTYWAAVSSEAAREAGGSGEAGLQTDWKRRLKRWPPYGAPRGSQLVIYSPANSAALLMNPL